MSEKEHQNRRRVPRREINQKVGLLIAGSYEMGRVFEVGEGGLLVSSPVPLNEDQKVVVTFTLKGRAQVIVRGTVRYIRGEESEDVSAQLYGIEFDRIDFKLKRQIRNFVASYQKTPTAEPIAA